MDKRRFCFTYKLTLAVSSVLLINCDVTFGLQAEDISPEQMKHKRADKFRISGQVKWTNTVVRREWRRTTSGTDSLAYTVDGNRLTISDSNGTLVCGLNAPISQSVRAVGGGGAGTALCSFSHDGDTIRINYDGTSLNKYGGAPFHDHRRILISINESNCTMSAQVNSDGDTALMRGSVWNGHFSHYTTHASASGSCQTE